MKVIIISTLLLLASATTAFGQGTNGLELYLNSGISFPSNPDEFADYWSTGFNFGGGAGYSVDPNLTLVAYFDYNDFNFDDERFLEDYGFTGYGISITGGEASSITLSGNLKVTLLPSPEPVRPYLLGGVGWTRISIGDVTIYGPGGSVTVEGESETAFSVLLGAGIDFTLTEGMDLFIQGGYSIAFTEEESTEIFPVKLGIKFK